MKKNTMKRKFLLTLLMGMLIAVVALCFGACDQDIGDIVGGDKTINLEPVKNAYYDGKTLSWDAVPDAVKYTVSINGGQEYSVSLPRYGYQANGSTFNVSICAKGNGDNIIDAEPFSMTFNYLGEVKWEETDEDGTLHWSVLAEATSYRVLIDGEESSVVGNELGDLPVGKHTVQVKPVLDSDPGYYANWTESKTVTILEQVQGSSISYKEGKLSWPAVKSASCYEVTVNGEVLTSNCTSSSLDYPSPEADFSVSVRAIGNHKDSFDGKVSEEKSFVYLETITEIHVENGIMSWKKVEHAVSYQLRINSSRTVTVTKPEYDGLTAGAQTNIKILPISAEEAFFSAWSVEFTVQILQSPTLRWFGDAAAGEIPANNISWNEISGAAGYTVQVTKPDGSSYEDRCAEHSPFFGTEGYSDEGTYTVVVKSNAPENSGNIYDSLYSAPITVIRLPAPVQAENNFITSDPSNLKQGVMINFKAVPNAASYSLSRNGTEQTQNSKTPSFHVTDLVSTSEEDETQINFSISSVGKEAGNNTYILSSLPSKSLNVSITILAMPQNVTIDGYVFSYGGVNRALGYGVSIDAQISVENGTSRNLDAEISGGTHRVSVCARGNGANILPSNFTADITVHRLLAPENIHIEAEGISEGMLKFEPVDYAQSYDVYFAGEQSSVAYDELENINNRISLQGTAIQVIANANYFSDPDTCKDYYMTSRTSRTIMFIRLDKPTFGNSPFTNSSYQTTQLNWNKPSNIEDSVPLHYNIYDSDNVLRTRADGRSLDISDDVDYAGGQQFSFKIKAIGFSSDDPSTQYVTSDYSDIISFWKLSTPSVTRRDGKYVWNAVSRAQRYAVYVDGVRKDYVHEDDGTYSYTPDFNSVKRYQVEIYAIGDNVFENDASVVNSAPKKYEQMTSKLATPEFTFAYSNETVTKDGTVTITLKKPVEHARGYLYYVDTLAQQKEDSTTYTSMPLSSVGTYQLGVQACGGNFDEENPEDEGNVLFYIDSEWGGRNANYRLILLGPPGVGTINLEANGFLTWASVQNATRYEIEVSSGGDTKTFTTVGNVASYEIDRDFYNTHKGQGITVRIRALGNDTKTIVTSEYVQKEWTILK